jgi:hypothetical protein
MNENPDLITPEQWPRTMRILEQFQYLAKEFDAKRRTNELLGIDESHPRYREKLEAVARYALELQPGEQVDFSQFVEYYDQWLHRERRRRRDRRRVLSGQSTRVPETVNGSETFSAGDPFSTPKDRDQAITSYQSAWSKTRRDVAKACGVAYQDLNKWKLRRELAKHYSEKRSRIEKELLRRPPNAI